MRTTITILSIGIKYKISSNRNIWVINRYHQYRAKLSLKWTWIDSPAPTIYQASIIATNNWTLCNRRQWCHGWILGVRTRLGASSWRKWRRLSDARCPCKTWGVKRVEVVEVVIIQLLSIILTIDLLINYLLTLKYLYFLIYKKSKYYLTINNIANSF